MNFNRSVSFEKPFGSVFFSHMLIRVHLYICIQYMGSAAHKVLRKTSKTNNKNKIPNTQDKNLWIRPWCFPVTLLLHLSSTIQESWQVYSPGKIADSFTSEESW